MTAFQQFTLLSLLCVLTISVKCPNQQYAKCSDVVLQGDCTGTIGGKPCQWKSNACTFQTCEDLTTAQCTAVTLQGAQCFSNVSTHCASALTCADYDSEAVCKTVSKVSCTWVPATASTHSQCRTSTCSDFTDPKVCLATFIGTNLCTWWGATGTCATEDCSYFSSDYCNTSKANGVACNWDAQNNICRQKICSDLTTLQCSSATQISPTVTCLMQTIRTGETCTSITSCENQITSTNCKSLLNGTECVWDQTLCRQKICSDFTVQGSCSTDLGCYWEGTCKTCSAFGSSCDCIASTSCVWKELNSIYTCQTKQCQLASTSSDCTSFGCYWNSGTLACGKTLADTVSSISDGSQLANPATTDQKTNSNNTSNNNDNSTATSDSLILVALLVNYAFL